MAVLLRTLGIPSRYVLGYASGRRQGGSGPFEVLDLNYHSWVEAYFPGYGWIPFEPTPPNAVEFGRGDTIVPPNVLDAPGLIAGLIADDDEDLDDDLDDDDGQLLDDAEDDDVFDDDHGAPKGA